MRTSITIAFSISLAALVANAGNASAQYEASGSASASASADSSGGGTWGVGVETPLTFSGSGVIGGGVLPGLAEVVYDTGSFHVDGLLGFALIEDNATVIDVGGRAFFVVHDSAAADFSLGGGLNILHVDPDNDLADDTTDIHLEATAKIRAFVTPNVALSVQTGVGIVLSDNGSDVFGAWGELLGNVGVTYFFR